MALKSGLSVAIMSAVLVSQLILHTEAQTGAARTPRAITFDCDPGQLHGGGQAHVPGEALRRGSPPLRRGDFPGQRPDLRHVSQCQDRHVLARGRQKRLAANPSDPLFVGDGLDDGVFGTSRITEHATVRIEIPLPPRVRLANDPAATSVTLIRGTPTTQNTPSLQPVFMYDGRDLTLEAQALGAVHAHAQNGFEPTPLQLELIAEFQRTSPRFFSSLPLFLFARGGPPPRLPNGVTASEKRGRAMFDDVPITPGSTRGLCAMCHSGPMLDVTNQFNIFLPDLPGLRFFGVGVTERNKLNLPTYEFIVDGTDRIVTPDPGACLTDPPDPNEFPPELFGPGGPLPLIIACNLFKTPSIWGVRHTAPYFHDNSSKTLEEVAEQYTFMFNLFAGITLTPQDEADIVAFLRLL